MKALLIVDSDQISEILSFYLKPWGFDLIRYRNPLKAIDNLEELMPDAVIMSARDFPRHWKPFVQVLRQLMPKERCVFVLLKGDFFPFEEAAKAMHLAVNGVIKDDLDDQAEISRFQQLLKRYISIDDTRGSDRIVPTSVDHLEFVLNHPETFAMVTGLIETINNNGLSFKPDLSSIVSDIEPGTDIEDCSLMVDDKLIPCSCTLVRQAPVLGIRFSSMNETDRSSLETYLVAHPERQIKSLLKRS